VQNTAQIRVFDLGLRKKPSIEIANILCKLNLSKLNLSPLHAMAIQEYEKL